MNNINVYTNYYNETKEKRRVEIERCVQENFNNKYINFIPIESQKRMSFNDFFRYSNEYCSDDDINIVSNLDIFFDKTILTTNSIRKGEFWCLARWDMRKDGSIVHANRPDSQDVWVYRGKIRLNAPFEMGKMGCDNRLAYVANEFGLKVSNPSMSIKCIHLHNSNIRNYRRKNEADLVQGPYLTIPPTALK